MTKTEIKTLIESDFIPGGKCIDVSNLVFRKTNQTEILRCCKTVGEDVQSGPIYCGSIAEYTSQTDHGRINFCERHSNHIKRSHK